jgi:hypothetical protein
MPPPSYEPDDNQQRDNCIKNYNEPLEAKAEIHNDQSSISQEHFKGLILKTAV